MKCFDCKKGTADVSLYRIGPKGSHDKVWKCWLCLIGDQKKRFNPKRAFDIKTRIIVEILKRDGIPKTEYDLELARARKKFIFDYYLIIYFILCIKKT